MDKLVVKPINDLLKEAFFIPSYQRGYRWTDDQVKNLLDDIWKFRESSEEEAKDVFYCLQPVVVSKKGEKWELIDGQQRLTTISIILICLSKQLDALDKARYTIDYETRPGSMEFLNNLGIASLTQRNDNVDYYHMCEAYDSVKKWFEGRDGNDKLHFLTTLLNDDKSGKNVKVIWYDVSDENKSSNFAVDIFTRLNVGKIPLTNSELIKALFLTKANFEDQANLRQVQIATEWDAIEKKLQDDSFWFFIYSPKNSVQYENRIEYIFDLLKEKTKLHEEYFTFNQFLSEFPKKGAENSRQKIEDLWLDVKQYFLTLEAWFNNRDLYHLIGFLIVYGYDINALKKKSTDSSKIDFIKELKTLIRKQLEKVSIDNLDFSIHKSDIRKVLLLFNIQSILSTQEAEMRFPFNKFKSGNWDIEHINSQTERRVDDKNIKVWTLDLLEYITNITGFGQLLSKNDSGKTALQSQKDAVDNLDRVQKAKEISLAGKLISIIESEKVDPEALENAVTEARKVFEEEQILNPNSISNLALLDYSTNRSYGNAMFPIKRKRIIDCDKNGLFVPLCTKNVFLKYYTGKVTDAMKWGQQDASDYMDSINITLQEYLTINNLR